MTRNIIIALCVLLLAAACSLERNNPLDPKNNSDIETPRSVTGLNLTSSGSGATSKWVRVSWIRNEDPHHYFVYRALSYNGSYQNITPSGVVNADTLYYYDYDVYQGNYYYYKISGVNNAGLEGPISAPEGIYVP